MASLHLTLLLCLAASTSAGPHHQEVAPTDHIDHTDHTGDIHHIDHQHHIEHKFHENVDQQELAHTPEGIIRDLVTSSEAVLEEYGVDKFTLRAARSLLNGFPVVVKIKDAAKNALQASRTIEAKKVLDVLKKIISLDFWPMTTVQNALYWIKEFIIFKMFFVGLGLVLGIIFEI